MIKISRLADLKQFRMMTAVMDLFRYFFAIICFQSLFHFFKNKAVRNPATEHGMANVVAFRTFDSWYFAVFITAIVQFI